MNVKLVNRSAEAADFYADEKINMVGEYHPDWYEVRDRVLEAFGVTP